MSQYAGIIEIILVFGGFMLWIRWQIRYLDKDRERRELEKKALEKDAADDPRSEG